MEDAKVRKSWIDILFVGKKVMKLLSLFNIKFNVNFIYRWVSSCMQRATFLKCETIIDGRAFWDDSNKWDQGKMILDKIEFQVSKIKYKDICIKEQGLWGWGLICMPILLNILRCKITPNTFPSYLDTHKSQNLQLGALGNS